MAETEQNQQIETLSQAQEKALEIFFKSFTRSLTAAQMYFAEHPSFDLALNEFKDKLGELSVFWQEFVVSIADKQIQINDIVFKKDSQRYIDLAIQFHRYKVRNIHFDVAAELADLRNFVLIFSRCEELTRAGKDIFEELESIKSIRVKELDYSSILSESGNFSENIWETLIGAEDQELLQQNADYLVQNISQITGEVNSLGQNERLAKKVLDRYGDITYAVERADDTQKRTFSRSIMKFTLSQNVEVQKHYLNNERFSGMRKMVEQSLDKNQVFAGIVNQITETSKINPLLTQFYNSTLHESLSDHELATELSEFLKGHASNDELNKVSSVVKELFLQDSSDKFVSDFYNQMLEHISAKQAKEEEALKNKYRSAFSEDVILDDYWYTLLDIIHYSDDFETVEQAIRCLEEPAQLYIKTALYDALCDLVIALEAKRSNLFFKELIEQASARLRIEDLIKEILMPNFKELTNKAALAKVVTCLAQPAEALLERFFCERDNSSRSQVIEILLSLPVDNVIGALESYINKHKSNQLLIKEAMLLFDGLWIQPAASLLIDLFESYKGNAYMQGEIGRVLIQNPYCPKEIFEPYIQDKHPGLRRLAITITAQKAESNEKQELMKKVLEVENWFGSADEFLISNIETISFLKIREAIPFLEKLMLTPAMFFKEKRDRLRIAALEALQDIDITVIFRHKDNLLKDPNPQISKIITNI